MCFRNSVPPLNRENYLLNRENLTQPIEMQLSQKRKTFSNFFFFFCACSKPVLNFKHFIKKHEPQS